MRGALAYLQSQFPLHTLGVTAVAAYAASYLTYGQTTGRYALGRGAIAGAMCFLLLFLLRRLIDDVEDIRMDIADGSASDGDRAKLPGIVRARTAVGVVIVLAGLAGSVWLAAVGAFLVLYQPLAAALRQAIPKRNPLRYIVVNTIPVALFAYPYVAWAIAAGRGAPPLVVVGVIGLFFSAFEFFVLTRKAGRVTWPPEFLGLDTYRRAMLVTLAIGLLAYAVTAAAAGFAALAVWGLAISAVFALWVVRGGTEQIVAAGGSVAPPRWTGLPYLAAVDVGLLIAVAVAH
jgi:hypothetical protein